MNPILKKGSRFIWKNARHLERAIFAYHFQNTSPDRIIQILRTFQNDDGGFGHALEPDVRTPESQPLCVEFALRTLYDCRLHDVDIAHKSIGYIQQHSNLTQGIPVILATSANYPRASHWENPNSILPTMDRLTNLVGLLQWQKVDDPWLDEATDACLAHLETTKYTDAHTIVNAFVLLECVSMKRSVNALFDKLADDLHSADFFILDTPVTAYGLTPLTFAPTPNAFCRTIFTDAQINAHLDDLERQQQEDGGWPITWDPPDVTIGYAWRAYWTMNALRTLRAYGRI